MIDYKEIKRGWEPLKDTHTQGGREWTTAINGDPLCRQTSQITHIATAPPDKSLLLPPVGRCEYCRLDIAYLGQVSEW